MLSRSKQIIGQSIMCALWTLWEWNKMGGASYALGGAIKFLGW
jgi:hypothetical protein